MTHRPRSAAGVTMSRHTPAEASPEALISWDELVAATPGTDVTQLSVWARVRAWEAFRSEHLFVWAGRRLVGGAQVLFRHVPGLGRIGYVAYGPVIAQDVEERTEVAGRLAQGLGCLPGVRMMFVQPPEHGEDVRQRLLDGGFRPSGAGIAPTGSVRLDLRLGLEDIRRGFSPRLRSWTRRWSAAGVEVRMGDEDDVPLLVDLMQAAARARGYSRPPSAAYLRRMYAELERTSNAALFIGETRGRPVTADMVTMCGAMVRGRWSGFDRCGPGAGLSVPGAARWAIIHWARAEGYHWLDFGGLSDQTLRDVIDRGVRSDPAWPGPDRAKMSYGGVPFRYPGPVELIRPAPLRVAYDAANRSTWGRAALHHVKVRLRSRREPPAPRTTPAPPPGSAP